MLLPPLLLAITTLLAPSQSSTQMLFLEPATSFKASCPLGNGRLGAMVFGEPNHERVVLNESTLWSGSPQDADRKDARQCLPEIRRLLLAGENRKAQELVQKNFVCQGPGSSFGNAKDAPYGCYQVLGNLHILTEGGVVSDYRRVLNLDTALTTISFRQDNITHTREAFASAPDQVVIYHYQLSKPKSLYLMVKIDRLEAARSTINEGELDLSGQVASGNTKVSGVQFNAKVAIRTDGVTTGIDGGLRVRGATQVTIIVGAGTSLFDKNFRAHVKSRLTAAFAQKYESIRSRHVADYQSFFRRVALNLGTGASGGEPLTKRLKNNQMVDDPSLATLYFNFGRYLLISSSRPDSPLPANLQGIWAEELQTPWNGDFHLNINVQMNYWPAEVCNLADCHRPLLDFIPKLVPNGSKTAAAYYGAQGWVAHVITNPWLFTSPGEGADWGSTPTGGAWLCEHLWSHFTFNRDRNYLKKIYPVIKGAAQFFLDSLVVEPSHGWLVTAPSNSPENAYVHPKDGVLTTCMGPTIDVEMTRELFTNVLAATKILGRDVEFGQKLQAALSKLPPIQVGQHGQIQEWLQDYIEEDVHHRHTSPLYALYPGTDISPDTTPDLARAAKVTLQRRGDTGTGWSLAWKVCFWARLRDGDHALKILQKLLAPVPEHPAEGRATGGTYPNLFDAHPPFQIDGNFGATAGIAEMLLQCDGSTIRLLPALPKAWSKSGSVRGLRGRGGVTVSFAWRDGKVTDLDLKGGEGMSVVYPGPGTR